MGELPGKLDDQNRVLAGQPHEHHKADLGKDRDLHARLPDTHERREQAHWNHENHGQRQGPALIEGREHEKHEHHAEHEQKRGRGPGADLHEGHLRPLRGKQRRDRRLRLQPVEVTLHDRQRRGAARPRGGLAVNGRRRIEVVAHQERRADAILDLHERRQGHRPAIEARHLELVDGLPDVAPVTGVGLHVDLPRPAEAVEVVDVI